jgi:hypothetical protein
VVKILKFFDEDPGWRQFGSGMEKSRIRDPGYNPGSATLIILMYSRYWYLFFGEFTTNSKNGRHVT